MASLVCFTCVNSAVTPNPSSNSPSVPIPKSNISFPKNPNPNLSLIPSPRLIRPLKAKEDDAHDGNQTKTKINSILCSDCDGNGAIACTQCEGTGVNSKDHFNGQFKAGALCWLCRGKRDILCGNCNGAGFLGGFMNAFED